MPYLTLSSKTPDLPIGANSQPIPVLGHIHGDGVPSSSHLLGTIAADAQATYALADESIYEIVVTDDADEFDGDAVNVLYKPGDSTVTIAALGTTTTDAMLAITSKVPLFQVHMRKGQTHLAIGNMTGSGKTVRLWARRLI